MHISGGEIMLYEKEVLQLIRNIRNYFKGDIGISTNGFWAVSEEIAVEKTAQLKKAGVTGVAVSADPYHEEFIPLDRPANAVNALVKSGLKKHAYIMGCRLHEGVHGAEMVNRRYDEIYMQVKGGHEIPAATPIVRSIGKGATINRPKKTGVPRGLCSDLSECLGQRSPFNPAMVWIDPYGNVMICYGIVIGNVYLQSFGDIINNYSHENNEITSLLAADGPKGLHALAYRKNRAVPAGYFDECDLCYQVRKTLRSDYPHLLEPDECYP